MFELIRVQIHFPLRVWRTGCFAATIVFVKALIFLALTGGIRSLINKLRILCETQGRDFVSLSCGCELKSKDCYPDEFHSEIKRYYFLRVTYCAMTLKAAAAAAVCVSPKSEWSYVLRNSGSRTIHGKTSAPKFYFLCGNKAERRSRFSGFQSFLRS